MTITHDVKTGRTREIKAGEEVKSVWDEIPKSGTFTVRSATPDVIEKEIGQSFYSEADAMEDAILFPEEINGGQEPTLYKGRRSAIDDFLRKGPDWDRFITDADTESDVSSSGDSDGSLSDEESGRSEWRTLTDEDDSGHDSAHDDGRQMITSGNSKPNTGDRKHTGSSNQNLVRFLKSSTSQVEESALKAIKGWKCPNPIGENPEGDFNSH